MKLSHEEVKRIALLARLGLSDEETEKLRTELSSILENFEVLEEVDTSNVLPTAHVIEMDTVMRDDEAGPSLPQSNIIANAPLEEEGFFRIKAVLE
jgi:aspartyl-tRNA(Asn)/glutamyl-tRNA(Gln) amidotransferase subunit C